MLRNNSDHLGSTVAMTEEADGYKYEANYDAFGNDSKSEWLTRHKFTGREYDEDLGLQYSRARWFVFPQATEKLLVQSNC